MKSKPKVLSIGHSYVVAANRAIMRQVAQLGEVELEIAAPSFLHGSLRSLKLEPEESQLFNVIPVDVCFSRWIHLMWYRNLKSIIKKGRYDLVHIWEEPYVLAGYQIAKICVETGTPYFFRSAQSLNKNYPFPFSYFEKFVVKHTKAWNAGASLVFENLCKRNYPLDKGIIISLGTDREVFYPNQVDREELQRELGLNGFVIGFSGRLVEAKGLDILMLAFEKLEGLTEKPWCFLALGSGPYKEKIEQWARERNIEKKIKVLLVAHGEMPKYMRVMDCLVAPSQTAKNWREQFGRMITEAFATEVPVIGSTSGEIPFVIDKAGVVVDEKDALAWAQQIAILIENPAVCDNYKRLGMERFLDLYEVSGIAKKYSELYKKIIFS